MSIMAHERPTTTDPTAVATAHSVGLLDEYTRTLDALPMDLSRHFADLRELDAVLSASVQQLILKVEALVAVLQAGNVRKEDRLWMLTEIAEEAARLKLGGEDKIRVVCTAADGLRVHNDHMASLLTQMPSFDRAELIRRTVYPHVTNRIFPPASYNEGGRRRRGALLTASNGAEPSSSNNKRKRNPKEDEDPAGGRTPRKERVGGEAAPPRNKNPNRTRKTERAPSPTESVVSVTSHIQNYTATQVQPSRSGGNRAGSSNKKRAAGGGSRPEPSPLGVPPAAHHPSLPAPPFMPSPGGAWPLEGPGVPRPVPLAGPGMPVPSQQPPQQSQPQAAAGEPMDEFDDPDRADDEKIYCFCNRPSFGSMIACDADDCEREWFHIECVGVTGEPEGKWYCDECRAKQAKKPPPRNRNAKSRKSGGARNGRATGAGQS